MGRLVDLQAGSLAGLLKMVGGEGGVVDLQVGSLAGWL